MRIGEPFAFVFDSRADVVHELLHGSHAHNLIKFECRGCLRIHVRVRSPMFTPFSGRKWSVPDGVVVTVDEDWQRWSASRDGSQPRDCHPRATISRACRQGRRRSRWETGTDRGTRREVMPDERPWVRVEATAADLRSVSVRRTPSCTRNSGCGRAGGSGSARCRDAGGVGRGLGPVGREQFVEACPGVHVKRFTNACFEAATPPGYSAGAATGAWGHC